MRISLIAVGLLLFVGLGLAGCSGEKRLALPEAKLQGTITYKGKTVPHALVVVTSGNESAQGFADENGKFSIEHVPSGPVQIGVNTEAGRGNMMGAVMSASKGGSKSAAPKFVDVPNKFFDPTTSGIQTTVNDPKGMNTFDIKIE